MKKRSEPRRLAVLIIFTLASLISFFLLLVSAARAEASDVTASLSANRISTVRGQTVTITAYLNGTDHLLDYDGNEISTFTAVIGYDSSAFTPASAPATGIENTLTTQTDFNADYTSGHVYYSGYSGTSSLNASSGGADNKITMVSWQFTASDTAVPGTYSFYLTPSFDPSSDSTDNRTYMNTYESNGEWQLQSSSYVEITIAEEEEITGFDALPDLNAGNAGSVLPIYATSSAVSEYLMSTYPTVSGNHLQGTINIPVTAWVDADEYNPAVAGSYTFTAALGALPSAYANTGGYTATVEVMVSVAQEVSFTIAGSGTSPNLRFVDYTTGGTTYHLIRGLNPSSTNTVANVMSNFQIANGYWKLYKNTTEVVASDATTKIGTNFKIMLYNNDNSLSATYYLAIMGDLNGDGNINVQDLTILQKHVSRQTYVTNPVVFYCANINNSAVASLNVQDLTAVQKHVSRQTTITQ